MKKKEYIPFKCGCCSRLSASPWLGDVFENNDNGVFESVLVRCVNCSSPNLVCRELWDENVYEEFKVVFPREDTSLPFDTPDPVASAFRDATKHLESETYPSCLNMCRKAIEIMCKIKLKIPPTDKRGFDAIYNLLVKKRIFNATIRKCLSGLRYEGNDATHNWERFVSKNEAEAA